MEKRDWCYLLQPYIFDITCDKCGGTHITWSEYKHKIWCYDCEIDTDGTGGIFEGPIPIKTVYLLGLTFDRINLKTQKVEYFNLDKAVNNADSAWDSEEEYLKNSRAELKRQLKDEERKDPYGISLRKEGSKYFKLEVLNKQNHIQALCDNSNLSKAD